MGVESVFDRFPVINVDDEFILRQTTYDDLEDYFEYISDEEVQKYIPEECIPRTLEQTREEIQYSQDLFKYRRSVYWGIALKKNNKLIGSVGFNYWNRDHARAEISYDLSKKYWSKGVMTKCSKAVIGFAFTQMQLHRIEATVTPTNQGSLRILRKHGFKREGLLREQKLLHGKFYDAVILSLLQKEYLKF